MYDITLIGTKHLEIGKCNSDELYKVGNNMDRYGVYIFHSAVVVCVTIILESLALKPTIKYVMACILSIVFSYMLVGLIRKIPLVKRVI